MYLTDLYCNFPEFQIFIICAHSRNIKDDYLFVHLSSSMIQTGLGVIVYINLCFIQIKINRENKLYTITDINQMKNSYSMVFKLFIGFFYFI